jgi:hypothetical protein
MQKSFGNALEIGNLAENLGFLWFWMPSWISAREFPKIKQFLR